MLMRSELEEYCGKVRVIEMGGVEVWEGDYQEKNFAEREADT